MVSDKDTNKLDRMGRRRFVSTMAALGVSAPAAMGLGRAEVVDLVDDPEKEVPRVGGLVDADSDISDAEVRADGRKPFYYTITRDQWRRVEGAHDARDRLDAQLGRKHDEVSVVVTTNANGEKQLRVSIFDDGSLTRRRRAEIERDIPGSMDGVAGRGTDAADTLEDIPIRIVEDSLSSNWASGGSREPEVDYSECDDFKELWGEWDEQPVGTAGLFYGKDRDGEDDCENGTLSFTSTSFWGSSKVLTAGHLIDYESDLIYVETESISVPNGDRESVDLEPWQREFSYDGGSWCDVIDVACVTPPSSAGIDVQKSLAKEDGGTTSNEVVGRASESRLKDLEETGTSSWETMRHQGERSGVVEGFEIECVGENAVAVNDDKFDDELGGDSGGPCVLQLWNGNYVAIGTHYIDTSCDEDHDCGTDELVWYTHAPRIESEVSFTF